MRIFNQTSAGAEFWIRAFCDDVEKRFQEEQLKTAHEEFTLRVAVLGANRRRKLIDQMVTVLDERIEIEARKVKARKALVTLSHFESQALHEHRLQCLSF